MIIQLLSRRLFALVAALGFIATSANAAPKIHFEKPEYDFGRVRAGTQHDHEFIFRNNGTAKLVLANFVPACGCSVTPDWTREIEPGGEGRIPLQFNSTGMLGQSQRSIAIHSNDPDQPVVAIQFSAEVWTPIELHPNTAIIQMPPRNKNTLSTTIRILNQTAEALKLQPPSSDSPEIKASIQENEVGKEFFLILQIPPLTTHEDIYATITIATSSSEIPELAIPVFVIAQPEVVVSPNQMFLPAISPDFPEPYVITINSNAADALTIEDPACDAPGSKVELREIIPGKDFELSVTFPPGFGYVPDKTFEITARTSHPDFATIRIPVAFAQPAAPLPTRTR